MALLRQMQELIAGLYDAPVEHGVEDFLVCDRRHLSEVVGAETADRAGDEHVFVLEEDQGVRLGLFIDEEVLERLSKRDPLRTLDDENLRDYCTALEGVSHFHYLVWSLARGRSVSLLELEVQAEVDKYATALALMTRQRDGRFPGSLHAKLFDAVSFLPHLDQQARRRYEEANRQAARFCRSLEERYLRVRRMRPEMWLAELRKFFRSGHHAKLRQLTI
ncbi:MAG TPA: hypothetical protein VF193_01480 [Steroidobacter sp.]